MQTPPESPQSEKPIAVMSKGLLHYLSDMPGVERTGLNSEKIQSYLVQTVDEAAAWQSLLPEDLVAYAIAQGLAPIPESLEDAEWLKKSWLHDLGFDLDAMKLYGSRAFDIQALTGWYIATSQDNEDPTEDTTGYGDEIEIQVHNIRAHFIFLTQLFGFKEALRFVKCFYFIEIAKRFDLMKQLLPVRLFFGMNPDEVKLYRKIMKLVSERCEPSDIDLSEWRRVAEEKVHETMAGADPKFVVSALKNKRKYIKETEVAIEECTFDEAAHVIGEVLALRRLDEIFEPVMRLLALDEFPLKDDE